MFRSPYASNGRRAEAVPFLLSTILLSVGAAIGSVVGFSLPVFLLTALPASALAFVFPRAGLAGAVVTTVLFERFFTLAPIVVGESSFRLYPLDMILVSVFMATGLLLFRDRGRRLGFRTPDALLLLFFAVVSAIFVSGIFGYGSVSSPAFSTWKQYVFYGTIFFATSALVRTKADLLAVGRIFLSAVAVAGIFLVIGIFRGEGLWTEYTPLSTPGIRILAFPHAFYFSLALLVTLFCLPCVNGRYRRYAFAAMLSLGIASSLMRHLWIGISATLAVFAMLAPRRVGASVFGFLFRLSIPVIAISLIGFSILPTIPGSVSGDAIGRSVDVVKERVLSVGSSADESLAWRGALWESSWSRFSEHPVTGIGFGKSVPVELGGYRQYVEVRDMHNSWLALLVQTGMFGFSVFLVFLTMLAVPIFRIRTGDPVLSGIRMTLLGLLLFQSVVFLSQPYLETNLLGIFFWITLGLMRSFHDIASDEGVARK